MVVGLFWVVHDLNIVQRIHKAVSIVQLLIDMAGDVVSPMRQNQGKETEQEKEFHGRDNEVQDASLMSGETLQGRQKAVLVSFCKNTKEQKEDCRPTPTQCLQISGKSVSLSLCSFCKN